MAITLVNSATIIYTSTTSPQTTATFTWAIGDVLVVVAGSENDTALEVTTISNTGSGLSWVNQQHIGAGSGSGVACTMNLWTAVATVASSGTISLTYGGGSRNRGADVRQYRGATLGASAQEATGALTVSLTVAGSNSTVVFCGYDFSAGTAPSAWTPAGHTTISNGLFGGAYTVSTQEWTGQTAGARAYGVSTGFGAGPTAKAVVELIDSGAADSAPIRGRIPAFRIPVVDRFFGQAFAFRGDFGVGFDPLNLAVTPTAGTTATLTWDAAQLAGVVDYSVFNRTPATGVPFVPGVDTPTASSIAALTYAATGLTGSTTYEWQVFGRVPDPFTPASLPNLVGWWDASDTATITASSGFVSQWNDKSGNARHMLQATGANQPQTGLTTQNSLNALSFTTGTKAMAATGFSTVGGNAGTYWAVFSDSGTSFGRVLSLAQSGVDDYSGTDRIAAIIRDSTANWGCYYNGSMRATAAKTDNVMNVVVVTRNGDTATAHVDGVAGTGASGLGTANFAITEARVSRNQSDGVLATATICEIGWCSSALSTTDRQLLEAYLKAKWGTP